MKYIFLMSVLVLTACASTYQPSAVQAEQNFGAACASYVAVMKVATAANNAGKLNSAQRKAIGEADAAIFPICSGPTPTDMNAAVAQVTQAVTTISINAVAAAEQPK
jgi:hypothetical protein